MKTEVSFIGEVSKLNNILNVCLRRTDGCTGQTKSYIQTDIQTNGQMDYQTNGRTEDKTTSKVIYNHKTHRQTSRSNGLMNKRTRKTR